MNIEPKTPPVKTSPEHFTGDVCLDLLAVPKEDGQSMVVAKVRFSPGARTAWHSHALGQTLHITEGIGLVGTRDGQVVRAQIGETVYTPAREEHWHGATPDDGMEHLAMLDNTPDPADTTTWLEHVTDEQYLRQ